MARSRRKGSRGLSGVRLLGRATTSSPSTRERTCLPVGEHGALTNSLKRICLNADQQRALRIDPSRKLGCGSYACVYGRRGSANTVVKLTGDADDVAGLLALQGNAHVVKVHDAWQLRGQDGKPSGVYAMVLDRLRPLPEFQAMIFDGINAEFGRGRVDRDGVLETVRSRPGFGSRGYRLREATAIRRWCAGEGAQETGAGERRCRALANVLVHVHEAGGRKGVNINDVHGQNWMRRADGTIVLSDAGVSAAPARAVPLMGARRRERR